MSPRLRNREAIRKVRLVYLITSEQPPCRRRFGRRVTWMGFIRLHIFNVRMYVAIEIRAVAKGLSSLCAIYCRPCSPCFEPKRCVNSTPFESCPPWKKKREVGTGLGDIVPKKGSTMQNWQSCWGVVVVVVVVVNML